MAKRPIKNAPPIRPPRSAAAEARRYLADMASDVIDDLQEPVEWLKSGSVDAAVIANALDACLRKWESANTAMAANRWVGSVDGIVKAQLTERVRNAIGVDAAYILDDENIRYAVSLVNSTTAHRIKDVPRQYIQNVADAALQKYRNIPFPEGRTLAQHLAHVNHDTYERAKFIARQQTSVINATINQVRQTAIGIEEYFWSSSFDERTVGNPTGLYPKGTKGHGEHYKRDYRVNGGKSYRWDERFDDGFPGEAYNCRCVAIARINMDKLSVDKIITLPGYPAASPLVA